MSSGTMSSGMDKLEDHLLASGGIDNTDSRLLREVVYEQLFNAIRTVRPRPGEALSEPRLAKALGISRTPVREALHLLTQAGMLEIIPGRAVLIASPSIRQTLEAVEIREILEPEMMASLVDNISTAALETWFTITDTMTDAAAISERPSWSIADDKWHELASRLSPNKMLGDTILQVRNRIFIVSNDENVSDQYLIDGTAEHRKLVEAISNGQAAEAKQIWREHIKHLKEDILKRHELGT